MLDFNLDDYRENSGGYAGPVNGGYVLRIVRVENNPDRENIMVELDIEGGGFDHYYSELQKEHGFWAFRLYQSYKPKARGFFKHFVNNIAKSNDGFKWTGDEKALEGMLVGGVCRIKEYVGNDGKVKSKLEVAETVPAADIESGNFRKAKDKLLDESDIPEAVSAAGPEFREITDDDVPF